MTKDEYFAAVRKWPWGFQSSVTSDLPREWIAEAWDLPEVQDQIVPGGFTRHVSKTGSLCYGKDYLTNLSACLSADQVRRLYLAIREKCLPRESEFRPEFLSAFAEHAHAIPPALTDEEVASRRGFATVGEMNAHDERLWAESVPPGDVGDEIPF